MADKSGWWRTYVADQGAVIGPRIVWGAVVAVISVAVGCGQPAPAGTVDDPDPPDARAGDVGGDDTGVPSVVGPPTRRFDGGWAGQTPPGTSVDGADADGPGYAVAAGSVKTCGQYFACLQHCPPNIDSCADPCAGAMTEEAAGMVDAFLECVDRHGCIRCDDEQVCRDDQCILGQCGWQMSRCYHQQPS